MVEDTLILPDDLPANVIVPIVNFMYTGTLKFHNQLFEKLLQTSKEMKLSVLSKLLEFHRPVELEDNGHSRRPQNSVAGRPKPRVLYRQTPPTNKLIYKQYDPYSNTPEPTSDPLAIAKVEKRPTSSIRVINSTNLIAKPRRIWDAREEHIPKRHVYRRVALPPLPVPMRNIMAKRMTYQKRLAPAVKPTFVQQTSESRTPQIKEEPSHNDPLSISLAQEICDDDAAEFQELPFKIESVRTMQSAQASKRPAPLPPPPQEVPKRVKKEENVLEISDDSFEGADDDFLLSLKEFDSQNVENI